MRLGPRYEFVTEKATFALKLWFRSSSVVPFAPNRSNRKRSNHREHVFHTHIKYYDGITNHQIITMQLQTINNASLLRIKESANWYKVAFAHLSRVISGRKCTLIHKNRGEMYCLLRHVAHRYVAFILTIKRGHFPPYFRHGHQYSICVLPGPSTGGRSSISKSTGSN